MRTRLAMLAAFEMRMSSIGAGENGAKEERVIET